MNTRPRCQIRVLVSDDHAIMRAGLERLLRNEPEICIGAVATDGFSTIDRARECDCDVLLLDLSMPGPHGPELVSQIRRQRPQLPILVMTMHSDPAIVKAALAAGAAGYITKDSDPETLLHALRLVVRGEHYLEPKLVQSALFPPKATSAPQPLSARELQVLRRLADGQSNAQIARALFLSEKTVSTHKTHIMSKLGLASLAELVRYADQNLVSQQACGCAQADGPHDGHARATPAGASETSERHLPPIQKPPIVKTRD